MGGFEVYGRSRIDRICLWIVCEVVGRIWRIRRERAIYSFTLSIKIIVTKMGKLGRGEDLEGGLQSSVWGVGDTSKQEENRLLVK